MATYKSVEVTAKEASVGNKYNNLSHVKTASFTYDTTTDATGEYVELVQIPADATGVVGYAITCEATGMSDCDLGTTAGGADIALALDLSSATSVDADIAPVALSATGKVYLSYDGGTVSAAKAINGVIYYI